MVRISMARALWVVAGVAVGIAAIRSSNDFWLGATFLLTVGLLCSATLGAMVDRGRDSRWLGFAIFGWAYFLLGLVPGLSNPAGLPVRDLSRQIFEITNPDPSNVVRIVPIGPDGRPIGLGPASPLNVQNMQIGPDGWPIWPGPANPWLNVQSYQHRRANSEVIGRWLLVLAFARAGAAISGLYTQGPPWRRRPKGPTAARSDGGEVRP